MIKLCHETVLVTGASSGIGRELAWCFAAEHARNPGQCLLILLARSTEALEMLAEALRREFQVRVKVITADLARPETPAQVFAQLQAEGIAVDVVVNNAGFGLMTEFLQASLARQLEILQVNVTALTTLTGLFLPGMKGRRGGGILNVGSVAGFMAGPNMTVYYATKAYVLSFSEGLAEELAGTGVTVSVLCPGPTESNFGQVARGGKPRTIKTPKMTSRAVAEYGYRAFRRGKVIAVPGLSNRFLTLLVRVLPRFVARRITKRYNRVGM